MNQIVPAAAGTPFSFDQVPHVALYDMVLFVRQHVDAPPQAATIRGGNLTLCCAGKTVQLPMRQLHVAMRFGHVAVDGALLRGLLVLDLAHQAQLPGFTQRGLLAGYRQDLEGGLGTLMAMHEGFFQTVIAAEVERYAGNVTGMARDMRHIGSFSADAAATAPLTAELRRTVADQQAQLDDGLVQFMASLHDARETGKYAPAFDALQRFVMLAATISATPYWRRRAELISGDLALASETLFDDVSPLLDCSLNGAIRQAERDALEPLPRDKAPLPVAMQATVVNGVAATRNGILATAGTVSPMVARPVAAQSGVATDGALQSR